MSKKWSETNQATRPVDRRKGIEFHQAIACDTKHRLGEACTIPGTNAALQYDAVHGCPHYQPLLLGEQFVELRARDPDSGLGCPRLETAGRDLLH